MKRQTCVLELGLLICLALLFSLGTALENQQQRIAGGVLRLHVVANSDSEGDQAVKLRVRDAVLQAAQPLLQDATSTDDAKRILGNSLGTLEQAANQVLENLPYTATVSLNRELFGTRDYQSFSLPGGYYDALRVTLGTGEGKNWWCVVYPQICMGATAQQQRTIAVMGGVEDMDMLQQTTPEYVFKFKTLELFENLLGWFRGDGIPVSG